MAQRAKNGRKRTSPYRGVSWCKRRGKWVAQIVKGSAYRNIGRFDNEIDAAIAYDEAARELFGDAFKHFNFPNGKPRDPSEYAQTETRELEMPNLKSRKSKYIGVSWEKYSRKWLAMFSANRKQRRIGTFDDEVAAAQAYDQASRAAHGQWAIINFPTEQEARFHAQWYDRDRACKFFGVKRGVFKRWVREGKAPTGRIVPSARGGKRKVYTLKELQRMKAQMFADDKLFKEKDGTYHIPAGFLGREEVCNRFGVSLQTWWKWERQGLITCGMHDSTRPKLYRIEDIERLIAQHGFLSPPYPDPDRPGIYRVPLGGHSITRREAIIDAESVPLIEGGSCHLAGTSDGVDFVCVSFAGESIPLRRLVMGVTNPNRQIGHRNGDPLDCRRENLIVRTAKERSWTNCKRKTINGQPPTSRFKGVAWHAGKWRVQITAHGRTYYLGRFHDEIDAGEAYDEAARQHFGEHAWLNFPDPGERGRKTEHQQTQTRAAA